MDLSESSTSLLNKNISYICNTDYEDVKNLHGDISITREKFFRNNKKTVRIKSNNNEFGYPEKLTGYIKKHSMYWKKTTGKIILEEIFYYNKHYVLLQRDLNNNIKSKVYYDKSLYWVKTEYYDLIDKIAVCIIKPVVNKDAIEIYIYNNETKIYSKETYFSIDDSTTSDEKTVLNNQTSKFKLFVLIEDKEYVYLPKEEKDSIANFFTDDDELNNFITNYPNRDVLIHNEPTLSDDDLNLEVLKDDEEFDECCDTQDENNYEIVDTLKNDEFKIKEGFDIAYDKFGQPNYIGYWKNNKEHGLGITFRSGDNAAKINLWQEGTPCSQVAIFDNNCNLNYLGKSENSIKNGIGIFFNKTDKTYIVTKNLDNKILNATIFDGNGNIIYSGGFENNKKNGFGIMYNSDREIIEQGFYKDGKLIKTK
ncbi:MAG: hypothetical protein R3Y35_00120 [Clostridia bacterium]